MRTQTGVNDSENKLNNIKFINQAYYQIKLTYGTPNLVLSPAAANIFSNFGMISV